MIALGIILFVLCLLFLLVLVLREFNRNQSKKEKNHD